MRDTAQALAAAIGQFSSQAAFAAALSKVGKPVTSQAVGQWRISGIPPERCEPIETATDGVVKVEELRPDLQWERDGAGHVIRYFPAPIAIKPTSRKRGRRTRVQT